MKYFDLMEQFLEEELERIAKKERECWKKGKTFDYSYYIGYTDCLRNALIELKHYKNM